MPLNTIKEKLETLISKIYSQIADMSKKPSLLQRIVFNIIFRNHLIG